MHALNTVDESLVVMFARLAAIGRAIRDPEGTASTLTGGSPSPTVKGGKAAQQASTATGSAETGSTR
jgi:hypothetical protein